MRRVRPVRLGLAVMALSLALWPAQASAGGLKADFDGDGLTDLVRESTQSPGLTIQSSAGHGTVMLALSGPLQVLVAADVDHDGDLDLAARTAGSRRVRLWLNDGRGSFQESATRKRHRHRLTALPSLGTLKPSGEGDFTAVSVEAYAVAAPVAVLFAAPDTTQPALADAPLVAQARALESFGPRPPPSR